MCATLNQYKGEWLVSTDCESRRRSLGSCAGLTVVCECDWWFGQMTEQAFRQSDACTVKLATVWVWLHKLIQSHIISRKATHLLKLHLSCVWFLYIWDLLPCPMIPWMVSGHYGGTAFSHLLQMTVLIHSEGFHGWIYICFVPIFIHALVLFCFLPSVVANARTISNQADLGLMNRLSIPVNDGWLLSLLTSLWEILMTAQSSCLHKHVGQSMEVLKGYIA